MGNQGKARLVRFYYDVAMDRQKHIVQTVYRLVSTRADESCCCFAHAEQLFGEDHKIIYRHFATLYFIFVADSAESELGVLDLIHHFDRVNYILDEIVMSGMVLETNADLVVQAIKDTKKLETDGSTFALLLRGPGVLHTLRMISSRRR